MKSKKRLSLSVCRSEVLNSRKFLLKSPCATIHFAHITKTWLIAVSDFCTRMAGCRKKTPADYSQTSEAIVQMASQPQYTARILLEENITTCSLKRLRHFQLHVLPLRYRGLILEKTKTSAAIEVNEGRIYFAGWCCPGTELTICPNEPYIFTLNGDAYRGNLKIILRTDSNNFDAINYLPIDPYLAGVIGAEMPGYWKWQLSRRKLSLPERIVYISKNALERIATGTYEKHRLTRYTAESPPSLIASGRL